MNQATLEGDELGFQRMCGYNLSRVCHHKGAIFISDESSHSRLSFISSDQTIATKEHETNRCSKDSEPPLQIGQHELIVGSQLASRWRVGSLSRSRRQQNRRSLGAIGSFQGKRGPTSRGCNVNRDLNWPVPAWSLPLHRISVPPNGRERIAQAPCCGQSEWMSSASQRGRLHESSMRSETRRV
ncbi:hypothetical protein AAC387_Pa10g2027 [Persea americana]